MSVPEVGDRDDDQQVEHHSEQRDAGQQCFDDDGSGSNMH